MNFEKIDALEEKLIDILGEEGLLEALIKALGYHEKAEYYEFICRQYDIEFEV